MFHNAKQYKLLKYFAPNTLKLSCVNFSLSMLVGQPPNPEMHLLNIDLSMLCFRQSAATLHLIHTMVPFSLFIFGCRNIFNFNITIAQSE